MRPRLVSGAVFKETLQVQRPELKQAEKEVKEIIIPVFGKVIKSL